MSDSDDAPVGVVMVDALPLARYALAAMVTQTTDLRWSGGSSHVNEAWTRIRDSGDRAGLLVLDSALDPITSHIGPLCGTHPNWTVVVLLRTRHRTAGYIAAALGAGAHGVCARPAEPRELLSGLRQAHQHRQYLDPALVALADVPPAGSRPASYRYWGGSVTAHRRPKSRPGCTCRWKPPVATPRGCCTSSAPAIVLMRSPVVTSSASSPRPPPPQGTLSR